MSLPRRLTPALAGVLAVVAAEFFLATAVVLQYLRVDHDWVTTPLSFYLIGPHSGWLIAAYFALAVALVMVGLGFHLDMPPQRRSRWAPWLFGVSALCLCIVALAHTDLPGAARFTPVGLLHNSAAILAFLSASLAMLLQAWWLRYDARWRGRQRPALFLAALIFAALWVYTLLPSLPRGAMQKSVILLIVLWLLMTGRWLSLTWKRSAA